MPLKVLISGGGIAGPALGFWLARLGYQCTIVERFPSLRASGQQIDVRNQGVDVVERMGLLDEIRKNSVDEAGLQFVDTKGNTKALFAKEEGNNGQGFTSEFEIMRGDLCQVLYEASRESCEYRYGVTVDEWDDNGDRVRVKLSDGTEGEYDLLVAADGQESRIRKTILGKEVNEASMRPLDVVGCYYHLKRETADKQLATVYHAPQRRVASTRWHSEHQGQAYLFTMSDTSKIKASLSQDVASQKAAFAKEFQDAGWQCQRLVDAMHEADDFYAQEIKQVRSPAWSKGRVVLLGDAGYAPSPLTGMGTSIALIGAYVLAGEIARHEQDILQALKVYETTLRPFVEDTQDLPSGVPGLFYPESGWGIKLMYGLLGFASAIKLNKAAEYLVSRGRHKWQLPATPERAGIAAPAA